MYIHVPIERISVTNLTGKTILTTVSTVSSSPLDRNNYRSLLESSRTHLDIVQTSIKTVTAFNRFVLTLQLCYMVHVSMQDS